MADVEKSKEETRKASDKEPSGKSSGDKKAVSKTISKKELAFDILIAPYVTEKAMN